MPFNKKILFSAISIVLLSVIQNAPAQIEIKKGVSFGPEVTDNLSTTTGSFSKEPGFSFGYFTGINLYSNASSAYLLGVEFNFTRIIRYRIRYEYNTAFEYRWNRFIFDQKFRYSMIEISVMPEYHFLLNERSSISFFAGPSGGLGTQSLQNNEIARIKLDTLNYSGEPYYPYGEYNMDKYKTFASLNVGLKYYYSILVFNLRYQYTYVGNLGEINNFKNIYAQIGVTL